jgi:hypothetical protein
MGNKAGVVFNRLVFFMLLLSGFAQMPIFKRYYIADIPGLGWLADFEVTHLIHYGFAIIFSVVIFYRVTLYVMNQRFNDHPKALWIVKTLGAAMTGGIMVSGFFLVARNLPGYQFSAGFISLLDVVHLGLVLMFLLFSLAVVVLKRLKPSHP